MNARGDIGGAPNFERLPWHDSECLGCTVANGNDDVEVSLQLVFRKSEIVSGRADVVFHGCRGFYADFDLLAKRMCGNQIASASCEPAEESKSPFVVQLNERFDLYPGESVAGLFSYGVTLIHPSGQLIVLARSFSVRTNTNEGALER